MDNFMSQSGWNIPIIESLDGVCTLHNNRKSLNKNAFNSLLLLCWKKTGHDKLFIIIFLQKKQNKKKQPPENKENWLLKIVNDITVNISLSFMQIL